jgi:MYXO-CTERM domain-containing protein
MMRALWDLWPFALGGVLGYLLSRYTDSPWVTAAVVAAGVLVLAARWRRRRRRPPD